MNCGDVPLTNLWVMGPSGELLSYGSSLPIGAVLWWDAVLVVTSTATFYAYAEAYAGDELINVLDGVTVFCLGPPPPPPPPPPGGWVSPGSRTLVSGTCWKFTATPYSGNVPTTGVTWTVNSSGGGGGQFMDSSGEWHNTVTGSGEVWFKASGDGECKVRARYGGVAFAEATVHVRNVQHYFQSGGSWGTEPLGFWHKLDPPEQYDLKLGPVSIGQAGCNLCCYAMLSSYYSYEGAIAHDPYWMNEKFKAKAYSGASPYGYYEGDYKCVGHDETWSDWEKTTTGINKQLDINQDRKITEKDAWNNPCFTGCSLVNYWFDPNPNTQIQGFLGWPANLATDGIANVRKRQDIATYQEAFNLMKPYLECDPAAPCLIHVPGPHWVLAVGLSEVPSGGDQDIMILDSRSGRPTVPFRFLQHYNDIEEVLLIDRTVPSIETGVAWNGACSAHIFVTDPSGRVAGVTESGAFVDEIGNACYQVEDEGLLVSYTPEYFNYYGHKLLGLPVNTPCQYTLTLFGTGPSAYFITSTVTTPSGEVYAHTLPGGLVDTGVVWTHLCEVDPVSGNIATELIPPDTGSIQQDIGYYLSAGEITDEEVAAGLIDKLVAASDALDRGNVRVAANILRAFINLVKAHKGTSIATGAANNMIFHAEFIQGQLALAAFVEDITDIQPMTIATVLESDEASASSHDSSPTADAIGEHLTTQSVEDWDLISSDFVVINVGSFDPDEALAFMLLEACQTISELGPENFNSEESAIELTTTIDAMFAMLDDGQYFEALAVLDNDILQRIDGCANTGQADEDDWIRSIEGQASVYPLVIETMELLERLI